LGVYRLAMRRFKRRLHNSLTLEGRFIVFE
jgi:hypothetical protein